MNTELLLALPWFIVALVVPWTIRRRPRLSDFPSDPDAAPFVSVIVPARNEAANLGTCIGSLLGSRYPAYEIVIVDDRSDDGTTDIARGLARVHADRIRLVEGKPLPSGWVGKCWACWQGYRAARGDVLVFTDADTRHGPRLLGHAVSALRHDRIGLVTGFPRQLMVGFWERLVLPHIFTAIELRFRNPRRMNTSRNPRDAVANGQFMVFTRSAYETVGGHEAVKHEIVEDVRLAQHLVASGLRLFAAYGRDVIETRMYRSLGHIIEGWSKNLARGSRHSVDPWLRPFVPWLTAGAVLAFWVGPPVVLGASMAGLAGAGTWSASACGASLLFWVIRHLQFGAPVLYALLYPAGVTALAALLLRSAMLGEKVTWKGRRYGPSSTNSTRT